MTSWFNVTCDLMKDNLCMTPDPCQLKYCWKGNTNTHSLTHTRSCLLSGRLTLFIVPDNGGNGNTENNYILAWLQLSPEESVPIHPCYPSSPSEIFRMQRRALGAWSVLQSQGWNRGRTWRVLISVALLLCKGTRYTCRLEIPRWFAFLFDFNIFFRGDGFQI